jgi:hypothetical protein
MSFLLAQSSAEHFRAGRLFEYVGYYLAVLAFVILAGAVAWSVSRRLDGRARSIFRTASLAGLVLFQLLFGAGLLFHFLWGPAPGSEPGLTAPATPAETAPAPKLLLHVAGDGTLHAAGRSIHGDEFEEYLREEIGKCAAQGNRVEDVAVELHIDRRVPSGKVTTMVDTCTRLGIKKLRFTSDRGTEMDLEL